MNLRPGFRDISSGWMLVMDFNAVTERIEQLAQWTKANGPLLPDEEATVAMMIEVQMALSGDFPWYFAKPED